MDSRAELLYIQNVRDLEVAKYIIGKTYENRKSYYATQINNIQIVPDHKEYPLLKKQGGGVLFYLFCILTGFTIIGGIALIYFVIASGGYYVIPVWVWIVQFCSILLIGLFTFSIKPESDSHFESRTKKERQSIDNYNKQQEEIARSGLIKRKQVSDEWSAKEAWYKSEYNKVIDILNLFYSLSILDGRFRNAASVIFIYDHMSASHASLNDTLAHEHIENAIQGLESQIDQVINRLGAVIDETRCMHDENKSRLQQQISQNEAMLTELQTMSSIAQDTELYSQLAEYYSRTNKYFISANYLNEMIYMKKSEDSKDYVVGRRYVIKKEDWDRVLDEKNPNFEKDFRILLQKYIKNAEIALQKEKYLSRLRGFINLSITKNNLLKENWTVDLDVQGSIHMKFEEIITQKLYIAVTYFESLGMMEDYQKFYGNDEEQQIQIVELFARMYKVQHDRVGMGLGAQLGKAVGTVADKVAEKITGAMNNGNSPT